MEKAISAKKSEVNQQENHHAEGALHAFLKDVHESVSAASSKDNPAKNDSPDTAAHAKTGEHDAKHPPTHLDFGANNIYDTNKKDSSKDPAESFSSNEKNQKESLSDSQNVRSSPVATEASAAQNDAQKRYDAGTKLIAQESKRFAFSGIMLPESN